MTTLQAASRVVKVLGSAGLGRDGLGRDAGAHEQQQVVHRSAVKMAVCRDALSSSKSTDGDDELLEQMASFISVMIDQLPDAVNALPGADAGPDFTDAAEIISAHENNVDRLQQAGIVSGYDDGTFRPEVAIDRAQMASFIAQGIEAVTDEELPRAEGEPFEDITGTHQANIEKLALAGIVQGVTRTTYRPHAPTTRARMATMIARSLDHLLFEGLLAGWNVRYVDGAVEHGS